MVASVQGMPEKLLCWAYHKARKKKPRRMKTKTRPPLSVPADENSLTGELVRSCRDTIIFLTGSWRGRGESCPDNCLISEFFNF
jgi:hypothetical protein